MNAICKVVWSQVHQQLVVVSELVKGAGKTHSRRSGAGAAVLLRPKALALAMALGLGLSGVQAQMAHDALPTGGRVAAGSASIGQTGANMVIEQSSQRAVLNWQSFNVGKDAHVQFNNGTGATLNRVTGPEASTIMGRISATGQVVISNGNGVFFGAGSRVDVGSLVATTHGISNDAFMAGGDLRFERNGVTGRVVNEGELTASLQGYVALLAPEVRNSGVIVASKGSVALAAGEAITLQLNANDQLQGVVVEAGDWQALVDNRHVVEAEGGWVILSARALQSVQGGVVRHSGSISANSLSEVGGRIVLTGDDITLATGSSTTATGATGGGQVLVGGDWQGGANAERRVFDDPNALYQATTVTMEQGATINASATHNGQGGTVVLWSDVSKTNAVTTASGTIHAKGGAHGGDGGQIETSGANLNTATIQVDASAQVRQGQAGLWLIDPYDYVIDSTAATNIVNALNTGASGTSVEVSTQSNVGNYGSTGSGAGNITVSNAISADTSKAAHLSLIADGTVTLAATIAVGGDVSITTTELSGAGGVALVSGQSLTVNQSGNSVYQGVVSGAGALVKEGAGALTLSADHTYTGSTTISGGTLQVGDGGATGSLATSEVINNGTLKYHVGADQAVNYVVSGTGSVVIKGGERVLFSNTFLTTTPQTVASDTTVLDLLQRIAGGTMNGVHVNAVGNDGYPLPAGAYHKKYDAATNSATFQIQSFYDAYSGDDFVKVVFVKLTQSGDNVQASVYQGRGSNLTVYSVGEDTLGKDFSDTNVPITGSLGLATNNRANGYGVDSLYSSAAVGFLKDNTYTGLTKIENTDTGAVRQALSSGNGDAVYQRITTGILELGAGGAVGSIATTSEVQNGGVLIFNRSDAQTFDKNISGTGNVVKNNANTLTYTGDGTYSGVTFVNGGVYSVGNGGAAGSLTGDITNTANVTFNRSDDATYDGVVSGTGTLTKTGAGGLTLTNNQTYTGATTISEGQLVLSNNAPTKGTSGFSGPGQLLIQPTSHDFSADFSTNSWTFASTLGGLTVGKAASSADGTNDVNVTVTGPIAIAGPITVHGKDLVVNAALTSTQSSTGNILLKGSGNITVGADLTTNGSDITLWSDSDESGGGSISLGANTQILSRGGSIALAGGLDDGSNSGVANDGTPDGFASGLTTGAGIQTTDSFLLNSGGGDILIRGQSQLGNGVQLFASTSNTGSVLSDGGDINIRGKATDDGDLTAVADGTNPLMGVAFGGGGGLRVNSGTGQVTIDGSGERYGVAFGVVTNSSFGSDTATTTEIASSSTSTDAVKIKGDNNTFDPRGHGVTIRGGGLQVFATGAGGGILLDAAGTLWSTALYSPLQLLANSGSIRWLNNNSPEGIYLAGGQDVFIGSLETAADAALRTSSSDFTFYFRDFEGTPNFKIGTTGSVTIRGVDGTGDFGRDFRTSQFGLNANNLVMEDFIFGSADNTRSVTVDQALSATGDVSIYGKDLVVNAALTATGNILLKGAGNITVAADLTTNGSDITLWSDSDASGRGGINIKDNVSLDSRTSADRTANENTTGGGRITLAGGLDDGGLASGSATLHATGMVADDGRPDGYAANYLASGSINYGIGLGTITPSAGHDSNVSIFSGGGDIRVHGRISENSPAGPGSWPTAVLAHAGFDIHAGNTGDITMLGAVTSSALSTGAIGFDLQAWRESHPANQVLTSAIVANDGDIHIIGRVDSTTKGSLAIGIDGESRNGRAVRALIATTGTGNITLDGAVDSTDPDATDLRLTSVDVLALQGDINLVGAGKGFSVSDYAGDGLVVGAKTGTLVTSSSSDVRVKADKVTVQKPFVINTSGHVTVEPNSTSFAGPLAWGSNITLGATVSALTLGKAGNTAAINVNSSASVLTVDGPITVHSSGGVTQTSGIQASSLALFGNSGTGNFTLQNEDNQVDTLAASGVGNLSYWNSDALTIGTVGSTDGIGASGTVDVQTLTDDLTVAKDVTTTNTSANAVILNAAQDTDAGDETGGNVVLTGTRSITAGDGGTVKVYTGELTSTGNASSLVTQGEGRFRYNADEATDFSSGTWTDLDTGTYVIYREQPSAAITGSPLSMVYGESLPTLAATGAVNGDVATVDVADRQNSTSGHIMVGTYSLTSNLLGLGYLVDGLSSGLTVTEIEPEPARSGGELANDVANNPATQVVTGFKMPSMAVNPSARVSSAGVQVEMVQRPALQTAGLVTVSVPADAADNSAGLAFALPNELLGAISNAVNVEATLAGGQPLPSWLRFDSTNGQFVIGDVADVSFPLELNVQLGTQAVTVVISERSN